MSGNRKTPLRQLEEPALECGYDPFSRAAIAVGTVGVRHALVFTVVVQELQHGRDDSLSTRADEARSTRLDRLLRFDQTDVGEVVQDRAYRLLYVWIEVHRVYDPDIGPLSCYAPQCPTETYELLAEVLASMSRDENHSPVVVEEWKACGNAAAQDLIGTQPLDHLQQGVDYRVARKHHARRIGALAQQVAARLLRRREVQVGDRIGHSAVHLLGPW